MLYPKVINYFLGLSDKILAKAIMLSRFKISQTKERGISFLAHVLIRLFQLRENGLITSHINDKTEMLTVLGLLFQTSKINPLSVTLVFDSGDLDFARIEIILKQGG